MSRWYNVQLECGCLIAEPPADNPGGGGLIPCGYSQDEKTEHECGFNRYMIEKHYTEMESLLRAILYDGTGDLKNPNKRVWPIRAAHHREGRRLLRSLEGWRKRL